MTSNQIPSPSNTSLVTELREKVSGVPSIFHHPQPKTFRTVLSSEEDDIVLTKIDAAPCSVAHLEAKHAKLIREGDQLMEKSSTSEALAKYDEAAAIENQITDAQEREEKLLASLGEK
jgi:hypothetical protein